MIDDARDALYDRTHNTLNLPANRGVLLGVHAPSYETAQEWARRIGMGDAVAFEALAAVYREPLRRHALRIVRDEHVAEDLLDRERASGYCRRDFGGKH